MTSLTLVASMLPLSFQLSPGNEAMIPLARALARRHDRVDGVDTDTRPLRLHACASTTRSCDIGIQHDPQAA